MHNHSLIQTPEFSTTDATAEAQQNLFMIQEELRQIEVTRNKINSRLDALQENGSEFLREGFT